MRLLWPGFFDMADHFSQHILPADGSKLEAVNAGHMASKHEQLSSRGEILDPFDQQSVGWFGECDYIAAAGITQKQGDFAYQYKIPILKVRFQAAA